MPIDSFLAGQRALVTGGGRGIGSAIARSLAAAGASVVVSSRSVGEIDAIASAIGDRASAVACDVSDPRSVAALAETVGPVDIVVNNAGVAFAGSLLKTGIDDWNRMLTVNATGTFLVSRAFLAPMLERGYGRIVNVASVAGKTGAPYIAAYSASKHAVIGLTRSLAAETATKGVTVNAVCPGYVETDMTSDSIRKIVAATTLTEGSARNTLEEMSPQKRIFSVDEVARVVLFLCEPDARGITGQSLVLDGGGYQA